MATEPVGPAEAWCGREADHIGGFSAETSPGKQRLTSEEGSPDTTQPPSLANPVSALQNSLLEPAATRDVAEHFNRKTGFYRELEETRDVLLQLPGDEEQLANSQASRPGNFAVGDVVLANGRLGVVFWDGRPRHDYAMLVWKDDGTESGVRASEIAKAQPEQLEQEQPLDEMREVTCGPADLAGRSDVLSFRCLSDKVAALDLQNQRLRGWQVGAMS